MYSNRKIDAKLIAVIGPTGTGKTTFVNLVSGGKLKVGDGLESCTDSMQLAQCVISGANVTLIDTPGFDDTSKSQAEILKDIAHFLEKMYERGRKLSGMIYLHRISDNRVGGIARENFRLFTKICGRGAMKNVLIATTMWEEVSEEVGASREQELESKATFFKDAISQGARMKRHHNNASSALDIMRYFIDRSPEVLQMQHELVDEHKKVPETAAGLELKLGLEQQEVKHTAAMQRLRQELESVIEQRDTHHRQELSEIQEEYRKMEQRLANVQDEMRRLREERRKPKVIYLIQKKSIMGCLRDSFLT
ncbi:P-loop containing nucleoside triphosphate hydrolase protein [Laetiporus sulphureus 93-53]|uniref:p-loop containing nucleoside triphosphate hydrolase protein n=1 Tax=Laetiporus sulphureus 93-53 TaxID=1314785 RepID=A0A165BR56_9APHY|nr:P-loop containing nucleoside triphosphate hydrolase protein [Laetiporus sulphureus 93-53]KZT01502.1 P-loop containing nucleoside triphosphate hydrolase protein [Laetiporus sulphureus 93-53]